MNRKEVCEVLARHGLPPFHAGAAEVAARLVELEGVEATLQVAMEANRRWRETVEALCGDWTPTVTALPTVGQGVLVWIPSRQNVCKASWHEDEWYNGDTEFWEPEEVTHWRPLPPGPEGEGKETDGA